MDHDTAEPATLLGFSLPVGPISRSLPPLSEDTDEAKLSDLIRQKALVNVNILSEILTVKAINPAASTSVITSALDANYKLSGLAAKHAAKEAKAMGTVSITINMPSKASDPKTISGEVVEALEVEREALPDGE